jgi:hypothetical protein
MRFIVLTIIKLKNILLSEKFKQSRQYVSAEIASEGLHDPEELGQFQK